MGSRYIEILLMVFVFSISVVRGQTKDTLETDYYKPLLDSFPFSKYKVIEKFNSKLAKLDLKTYADLANMQYKKGEFAKYISGMYYNTKQPNFAGHYVIISWSCGSPCQMNAIIDAKTGKTAVTFDTSFGVDFESDSYLLILNPPGEDKFDKDERLIFGAPKIDIFKDGKLIVLRK